MADAALAEHSRWLRRARLRYGAAITAVLVLTTAGVVLAYRNGEISTVRAQVAASAAPDVPRLAAAPVLRLAWQSADASAAGSALVGGTVLTFSSTTVTGRAGRTGVPVWTYRRLHHPVCALAQVIGQALIVLGNNGNCDEVQALDAGTGRPIWDRTLDENGQPVDGTVTVLTATGTLFIYTAQVIYAVSVTAAPCQSPSGPGCGSSEWVYSAATDCRITSMVAGTAGVLINQHCTSGDQLLLHDRYQSTVDWTIASLGATPLAADDSFIAGYDPATASLVRLDAATGRRASSKRLPGGQPATDQPATAQLAGGIEIVTVGDHAYGVSLNGTMLWTRRLSAVTVDGSRALADTGNDIAVISPGTGTTTRASALPASADAPIGITPLGSGYLLQGGHTAAYLA